MTRLILLALLGLRLAAAGSPVYVMLWFDTEDYIQPVADDAALRIANDLTRLGVRATFKVVGEKARVLEKRDRRDVIRALSLHDIGYHSNFHSVQPTPALYLKEMGWLEGAAEFERREHSGVEDIRRVFGVTPSCYGQPGSSWAPQTYPALLRMGIPVYLDEATQVGIAEQPFWFGGMLNVFNMGRFLIRPNLDDASRLPEMLQKFDRAADELRSHGGGVISTYFHPTEFVTSKFWDAVNFARGANPARSEWRLPPLRTQDDSEKRYQVLLRYVEHAKAMRGCAFRDGARVPQLYRSARSGRSTGEHRHAHGGPADVSGDGWRIDVGGGDAAGTCWPWIRLRRWTNEPGRTTYTNRRSRARPLLGQGGRHLLHSEKPLLAGSWSGSASQTLALPDFAATLAGDDGHSAAVSVRRGNLEMEKSIATDPARPFIGRSIRKALGRPAARHSASTGVDAETRVLQLGLRIGAARTLTANIGTWPPGGPRNTGAAVISSSALQPPAPAR